MVPRDAEMTHFDAAMTRNRSTSASLPVSRGQVIYFTYKGQPWRRRAESNRRTGLCRPLPKPLGHAAVSRHERAASLTAGVPRPGHRPKGGPGRTGPLASKAGDQPEHPCDQGDDHPYLHEEEDDPGQAA